MTTEKPVSQRKHVIITMVILGIVVLVLYVSAFFKAWV